MLQRITGSSTDVRWSKDTVTWQEDWTFPVFRFPVGYLKDTIAGWHTGVLPTFIWKKNFYVSLISSVDTTS